MTTPEYDKSMFPDDLHEMNLGKYQQPLNRHVFKRQRSVSISFFLLGKHKSASIKQVCIPVEGVPLPLRWPL